jgi:hypothetical protein
MRGGRRPKAGRKAGVLNKRTLELCALAEGQPQADTPLEFLTSVHEALPIDLRIEAAGKAAPYMHPRPTAVRIGGDRENLQYVTTCVEIVPVEPEQCE